MNANNRFKIFLSIICNFILARASQVVLVVKTQETGSVPGLGRSPLGGNGN